MKQKYELLRDIKPANVYELLQFASFSEMWLMMLGTLCAVLNGLSYPIFHVLFGRMLNAINENPQNFESLVDNIALSFVYVSIANFVCGFTYVTCWIFTGERQSQRIRERYVQSLLGKNIGWFDVCKVNELSLRVAELSNKVQDGIGRKVGDAIQCTIQFIASLAVAFYLNWRLALVLCSTIPLLGFAGTLTVRAITSARNLSFEQYAKAGSIASESLLSIRTVTALNIQHDFIGRYTKLVTEAMEVGIKKGQRVGFSYGLFFLVILCTYALGFWCVYLGME